jgi:hypothetical protein
MAHFLNLHPELLSGILGHLADRERETVVKRVCSTLRDACQSLVGTLYAKNLHLPSTTWIQYPAAEAAVITAGPCARRTNYHDG